MPSCVFCDIVAGRHPGDIVHRDPRVTAFRDIHPQAPTHILVVPNEHVPSLAHVGEGQSELLGKLFAVVNSLAEREGIADGYRVVINCGRGAGQTVDHLHIHLLSGRRFRP